MRAKQWVIDHIAEHGGDPSSLTVSGHSAGAHLASFLFHKSSEPSGIRGALLLGGVYDLAPLRRSFLQAEIALTDEEVAHFAPLDQLYDRDCRVVLAVGENETRPFHSQLDAFQAHLRSQGLRVSPRILAHRNHMDSVRDLGTPGTEAGDLLFDFLSPRSGLAAPS
jgi:arylformamidase